VVDTVDYLYGLRPGVEHVVEMSKGVSLYVGLEAIGEADDKGMRTVMTVMNGQLRPVFVRDRSVTIASKAAEKADPSKPGQVAAPFSGVVTLQVEEGAAGAGGAGRRIHRGHENGSGDHGTRRRNRSPRRDSEDPAGGCRRPHRRDRLSTTPLAMHFCPICASPR
jgi:hypothetical protein